MTADDLKALRQKLGLTQTQLAEKLGVKRNTINRWEMGMYDNSPMKRMAEKVLEALPTKKHA